MEHVMIGSLACPHRWHPVMVCSSASVRVTQEMFVLRMNVGLTRGKLGRRSLWSGDVALLASACHVESESGCLTRDKYFSDDFRARLKWFSMPVMGALMKVAVVLLEIGIVVLLLVLVLVRLLSSRFRKWLYFPTQFSNSEDELKPSPLQFVLVTSQNGILATNQKCQIKLISEL